MRTKEEILTDGKRADLLTLEVLLDIREILSKKPGKTVGKPRGRPRKKIK